MPTSFNLEKSAFFPGLTKAQCGSSLLMTSIFALFIFLGVGLVNPPYKVGSDAPVSEFASGRAIKYIEEIAKKPHPPGSPEHAEVRDYLIKELSTLGLTPQIQKTTAISQRHGSPYIAATIENIVARKKGEGYEKAIMLVGHYDSVPTGPGANDDGSGVATVLETLRALQTGALLKRDIIILLTDGEEAGLLGAKAFVDEHPWAKEVELVLNFEAHGNTGPAIMFETSANNGWLIDEFAKAAPYPVANSLSYEIYRLLSTDTDLSIFKDAGLAGLNFAYIAGSTKYHSQNDSLANVDEQSLQHQGSYALALTRHFGNLDTKSLKKPNAVYFNTIGTGIVHYSSWWNFPLVAIVILGFVGILWFALRRGRISIGKSCRGFLLFLLNMIVAPLIVFLLWLSLDWLGNKIEWISLNDFYRPELYIISFIALTLAITLTIFIKYGKKIGTENLALAGLAWSMVFMVLSLLFFPGGTYLFLWPSLFSLIAFAVIITLNDQQLTSIKRLAVLAASALPAMILWSNMIYLLVMAMGIKAAIPVSLMIVLLSGLLVPQLEIIATPHKWLVPGVALVVSLGFMIAGSFITRYDDNHPKPDHIFYSLNAETGKAIWASVDQKPDEWTSQFLSAGTSKGAIPEYAPARYNGFLNHEAFAAVLQPPNLTVLEDIKSDNERNLSLRITSARQAPVLMISIDPETEILMAQVNGKQIDEGPNFTRQKQREPWRVTYHAVPVEGIQLSLKVKSPGTVSIRVLDQSYGLPEMQNEPIKPRPRNTIPSPFQPYSESTLVSKIFNL